jgi:hypothetical protein
MKVAEPRPHHPSPFAGRGAALLVALALPSLCGVAVAQQATLTGSMLRTPPAAVPAKTRAATPSPPPEQVGDATQALLRMQVDGAQAAPALPMLGDEANAAYRRYLQSFTHPFPEFFPAHVRDARDDSR